MAPIIERRPAFPVGHDVGGAGVIERVLHSDASVEVYGIAGSAGRVLVHVRAAAERPEAVRDRLKRWWNAMGADRVRLQSASLTPSGMHAVVDVRGVWLGEERTADAELPSEPESLALLSGMCDAIELALKVPVSAALIPSLVWWDTDENGRAIPIFAEAVAASEAAMVRSAATVAYAHASGIDISKASGPVAPLHKWAKSSGPMISHVLGRCLSEKADRIRTVAEARDVSKRTLAVPGAAPAAGVPGAIPGPGKGLAGVAGMKELRSLLEREVVQTIRNPGPSKKYGLTIPNGILLYGPPGCGKTWIARKLAEEVGHYFVEIIPSELASPYIHGSVIRIRELFDTAVENAPAIIFIDEFEALVPSRAELGGFQQHKSEEVNEFLTHLNSCAEKQVFIIAATNEPQKIDAAVRRTGRFDELIYVGPPDAEARAEMLRMHLKDRPVAERLDYDGVAAALGGYAASDIKFLVDQAARAAMERSTEISGEILLAASQTVPASVPPEVEKRFRSFGERG